MVMVLPISMMMKPVTLSLRVMIVVRPMMQRIMLAQQVSAVIIAVGSTNLRMDVELLG